MLFISKENYIGSGANQDCFEYPNNIKKCIKIPKKNSRSPNLLLDEIRYIKKLSKRKKRYEYPFFLSFIMKLRQI